MFRLVQNKKSKPNFVGFCRYGANVGLMVCLALVRLGLSQVCAQTPDDGEFLSQIRDAINEASAVRVFKLERPLSADDPELTARDIPPALIERAFDRYDFRLGSLLEALSERSSYNFKYMLSERLRARYGVMFSGTSGKSALLIPLPPTDASSRAMTVRFVSERPLQVSTSSALLTDGVSLITKIEFMLKQGESR